MEKEDSVVSKFETTETERSREGDTVSGLAMRTALLVGLLPAGIA